MKPSLFDEKLRSLCWDLLQAGGGSLTDPKEGLKVTLMTLPKECSVAEMAFRADLARLAAGDAAYGVVGIVWAHYLFQETGSDTNTYFLIEYLEG